MEPGGTPNLSSVEEQADAAIQTVEKFRSKFPRLTQDDHEEACAHAVDVWFESGPEVRNQKGFLWTVYFRRAVDLLRKRAKIKSLDALEIDPADKTGCPAADLDEELLRMCVEKLSPRSQRILELRFRQKMTWKQIADELRRSVKTVFRHYTSALSMLRVCLSDRSEGGRRKQ